MPETERYRNNVLKWNYMYDKFVYRSYKMPETERH